MLNEKKRQIRVIFIVSAEKIVVFNKLQFLVCILATFFHCLTLGNFFFKFDYAVFKDREKRWFLFLENALNISYVI